MATRRKVLAAFVGGCIFGGASTFAATSYFDEEYSPIQWNNRTDEHLLVSMTIERENAIFGSEVVYEDEHVVPPTPYTMYIQHDILGEDEYHIEIEVELRDNDDDQTGPHTITWTESEDLLLTVIIDTDLDVDFLGV